MGDRTTGISATGPLLILPLSPLQRVYCSMLCMTAAPETPTKYKEFSSWQAHSTTMPTRNGRHRQSAFNATPIYAPASSIRISKSQSRVIPRDVKLPWQYIDLSDREEQCGQAALRQILNDDCACRFDQPSHHCCVLSSADWPPIGTASSLRTITFCSTDGRWVY